MVRVTKSSCQRSFSNKIRKNTRENPQRSRKQNIAIAASQVKKSKPGCKRFLNKRFNNPKRRSKKTNNIPLQYKEVKNFDPMSINF